MTYLKYYQREQKKYSEEIKIKLPRHEVVELCHCIFDYFEYPPIPIVFKCNSNLGTYREGNMTYSERISFHRRMRTDINTIAHEIAHYFDRVDNGSFRPRDKYGRYKRTKSGRIKFRKAHTKTHAKYVEKIMDYIDYLMNKDKYDETPKINIGGELIIEI